MLVPYKGNDEELGEDPLYLREDAYFEPLFNHWYAWPYLVSPVTAARHLVNTHRRIMQSFVANARLHGLASKESALTGGEFLNYAEDKVADIQLLIEEIDERCGDLVALSEAVEDLDELLRDHTSGRTIEHLYAKIPGPLKGYIELLMDLEHRVSYRLIEPLLYRSPYYKRSLQTLSFGLLSRVTERPFVLSTPRLPDKHHLHLSADFASPLADAIFETRQLPKTAREIDRLFAQCDTAGGLPYRNLFHGVPPQRRCEPVTKGVRLRYTGHAGFMIETTRVTLLVDPVIASRGADNAAEIISFAELPEKIDFILLTHTHTDHSNLETLLQLRFKTMKVLVPRNNGGTLADPSIKLLLRELRFDVQELDELEEIGIPDGRIVSLPFLGEHGDLNIRSKTAWFIELHNKRLFFGADSSNPDLSLYKHLAGHFGNLDVFAIGLECVGAPYTWVYGALHTTNVPRAVRESRRLNGSDCAQALAMVDAFNPRRVFAYALGRERWYRYFMGIEYQHNSRQIVESQRFIEACRSRGIVAEALYGKHTLELW